MSTERENACKAEVDQVLEKWRCVYTMTLNYKPVRFPEYTGLITVPELLVKELPLLGKKDPMEEVFPAPSLEEQKGSMP